MDPNQDTTKEAPWQEDSTKSSSLSPSAAFTDTPSGEVAAHTLGFYAELDLLKSIIKGTSPWSKYLNNANFLDIKNALKIIYSYHPKNDGKNKEYPKVTLGDIEQMREDMMHLSALNCYLAAQAAMYESNADNVEQERKLCRSLSYKNIRKNLRDGTITEKYTQADIKHEAEADATDLYRVEYELRQLGRMYNWVRAAVRTFTDHLGILIQSSMREERGDAKLR